MVAALAAAAVITGCKPQPGLGTITYLRGTTRHRTDLATCRDQVVRQRVRLRYRAQPIRSPDGRATVTVRSTGKRKTLRETIWVTDRRTGRSRPVYTASNWGPTTGLTSAGPIELVRWSGDSRWILFAIDPGSSASIAADGLILRVVSANGEGAHRLPAMLIWPNYMAWCGDRLVFTAGTDRVAIHHKELDVAAPPDWRARPLVQAPGRAWGAVSCAPDQRSVVAQSQPQSEDANFFATRWELWRVGLDGSKAQLTSPPAHYADESPRFSRDGTTIMFVRSRHGVGRLYALRSGKLEGPLISLGYSLGYYGHQDWWQSMTWSLAAP